MITDVIPEINSHSFTGLSLSGVPTPETPSTRDTFEEGAFSGLLIRDGHFYRVFKTPFRTDLRA